MGSVEVVRRAEVVARRAHEGQLDKAGRPYAEHPAAVAAITAERYPGFVEAIAVAWLHDVVEDTSVTLEQVRDEFGDTVAAAVDAITRRPVEDPDDYYRRVAADPIAVRVKRADLHHNSDPDRLAVLPAELRERLTAKYRHATEVLEALVGR